VARRGRTRAWFVVVSRSHVSSDVTTVNDVTVINEDVKPRNDEFEFGAPRTTRRDARDPRIAEVKRKIEVTY
jgi:hypothetical protein